MNPQFLPSLFFGLAAFLNAAMDVIIFHFKSSIFRNYPENQWNPMVSWLVKKPVLGIVRLDGWHVIKYFMVASFAAGVYFAYVNEPIFGFWDIPYYVCVWGLFAEMGWRTFKV